MGRDNLGLGFDSCVRARAHRFGPWYNQSFWYNTMVYVSYIVETEATNANNKTKCLP